MPRLPLAWNYKYLYGNPLLAVIFTLKEYSLPESPNYHGTLRSKMFPRRHIRHYGGTMPSPHYHIRHVQSIRAMERQRSSFDSGTRPGRHLGLHTFYCIRSIFCRDLLSLVLWKTRGA
jgi:hypothetical protein